MIRGFLTTVLTFLWALWLGGIVALALNIATIAHVDRQILDIAGSAIFHHFMHYELTLAAMILGILLSWSLIAPARRKVFTFMIFLLAAAALAYNRFSIVPRMDALLDQHQTATVEFQRLHSTATHIYGYELALLILAGLLLPGLRRSVSPTTSK
jgi:glucan phosphoethanolaminetransferase (alkaline phosphatase superfamily)